MALDTSIPMSYNPSAKLDIEGAYNFAMNRRKNALLEQNAQMEMAEKQNALRQQRELRNFLTTADFNDPTQMTRLAALDPKVAADMAQFQSHMATTGKTRAESQTAKLKAYRDAMGSADTPEAAMALLTQMHRDPDMAGSPISGLPLEQVLAQVPKKTDATGRVNPNFDQMWQDWHNRASMGMDAYLEKFGAPVLQQVDTGGGGYTLAMPKLGGPASIVPGSQFTNTLSPADRARLAQEAETGNYSNEAINIMAGQVAEGLPLSLPLGRGSKSDALKSEIYRRAAMIKRGMSLDNETWPGASPSPSVVPIATPSPNGVPAATPKPGVVPTATPKPGAAPTTSPPRISDADIGVQMGLGKQDQLGVQSAIRYFASGPVTQRITAINTAVDHLDTLSELATALKNNDVKLLNKVSQAWKEQTGQEAPVDFDAAKLIVAAEIIKAIVANGGTGAEREEAANKISRTNSPEQLMGVIKNTYLPLLAGQLSSIRLQYKTTTRRDNFDERLSERTRRVLGGMESGAGGGGSGSAVKITSDAQYNSLPSGALYIAPDGTQRRKK